MSDIIIRPVTRLVRELGQSRRGFNRLLVAALAAIAASILISGPKDNLYAITIAGAFSLFVIGFIIYDYLEPERIRGRRAREEIAASVTKSHENNLARIIETVSQTVVSAAPPAADLPAKKQSIYIDTVARTLSSHLKESLAVFQTDAQQRQLVQQAALIRSRLEEEIAALGRRGRVNLTIGALFAFSGIGALGYFALWHEYKDFTDLGIRFFPRITFVILVEVFSYFFLNLYRHSIFEIKYFQNEMTNMDSRTLALHGCLLTGDVTTAAKICEKLAQTERNFVLKKGETSLHEREMEIHAKNERTFVQNLKEVAQVLGVKGQG